MLWLLPSWGVVAGIYFFAAHAYLKKKTGFSYWRVWLSTGDNLPSERRFAEEIRGFPAWNLGYQLIKLGTICVVVTIVAVISRPFWS
jgi:hypothetical protein